MITVLDERIPGNVPFLTRKGMAFVVSLDPETADVMKPYLGVLREVYADCGINLFDVRTLLSELGEEALRYMAPWLDGTEDVYGNICSIVLNRRPLGSAPSVVGLVRKEPEGIFYTPLNPEDVVGSLSEYANTFRLQARKEGVAYSVSGRTRYRVTRESRDEEPTLFKDQEPVQKPEPKKTSRKEKGVSYWSKLSGKTEGKLEELYKHLCSTKPEEPKRPDYVEYPVEDEPLDPRVQELRNHMVKVSKDMGLPLDALFSMMTSNLDLSSILITEHGRIVLIDYDKELVLTPMNATVYILFLRHPEGINFKDLIDYRKEILAIYRSVSNKSSIEEMEATVNRLIDPSRNEMNVQRSKIRKAILNVMPEYLCKYYEIYGAQSDDKRILLDRRKVIDHFRIL